MVLTFFLGGCSWLRRSEALSLAVSIAMGTSSIIMSIPTRAKCDDEEQPVLGRGGLQCVCECVWGGCVGVGVGVGDLGSPGPGLMLHGNGTGSFCFVLEREGVFSLEVWHCCLLEQGEEEVVVGCTLHTTGLCVQHIQQL